MSSLRESSSGQPYIDGTLYDVRSKKTALSAKALKTQQRLALLAKSKKS